jgi:ABC-type bacteriocin/lantibiotic exporter with double-glycine peptidase domain
MMGVGALPTSPPQSWLRYAGRSAVVLAPAGSFAATRAAQVLHEADQTAAELERLLGVSPKGPVVPLDILLVDVAPAPAAEAVGPAAPGPELTPGAPAPLLRVISPESATEPLAQPMTRVLAARWFGEQASAADTVLHGLAGLVAARVGTGPSRADADAWVQARLADRRLGSLFAGTGAAAVRGPPAAPDPLQGLRRRAARPGFHLAVLDGDGDGGDAARLVELPPGSLVVGRDPGADLVLDDPNISRHHAVLVRTGEHVEVRDDGSANGTRVNGRRVGESELSDGDRIGIGRWELVLLRVDPEPAAGPAPAAPAPGPAAPPMPGADLAFTSFAGYLLDEFGAGAVREFLRTFDPERQDRAAVAVFHSPLGALEEAWHARQRQQASGGTQVRAFVAQILPLLRPHRRRLAELTALTLLATVNTLALPLGFRYFVDHVLPGRQVSDLLVFTAVLGALFLVGTLISLRRAYLASRLSERIGVELQEEMFVHMQRMSHSYFSRIRGGDLLSRFTRDLIVVQQALVSLASGGVALIISAAAAFVTLALLNVYVAALVASVLPMYVIAHAVLHTRFRSLSYERQQQAGETAAVLQETMEAHDLIKAYGGEDRALDAYRVRLQRQLETAYRLVMTGAGLQASVGLMAAVAQVEILCLGGYLVIKGHMSLGTLLAAISLAPSVMQPVNQLSQTTQNAQAAAGAMSRIRELLDQPPGIVDRPDAATLDGVHHDIVLDAVTLSYGAGRPSLDGASLRIPAGAHVAFVGPSGAGKTSVLNLLLRFWDPTAGRVLVDGHDAREVTVASLRRSFGVILQDTFIFNTTVRANIAFGRPEATDEQIAGAARAAQLHEFIANLPAGYETVLGDRGVRMSGGQRQRLAIARALLRDPQVLILDEATSALDARTEADMRRSLAEAGKGRTVVSISHRLASIVASDRIFVLAAGRVAQEGTHDELLAAGGLYRQLWDEQHGGAEPDGGGAGAGGRAGRAGPDPAEALRAVPLLADAPAEALEELGRAAMHERYGAGTEVGAPDQPMGRLLVVLDGELELVRDDGEEAIGGARLGRGDFIGELALLREQRFPATLRASTPLWLLAVARPDFLAVAGRHPELQRAVLRQLARRRAVLASAASASGVGDLRTLAP